MFVPDKAECLKPSGQSCRAQYVICPGAVEIYTGPDFGGDKAADKLVERKIIRESAHLKIVVVEGNRYVPGIADDVDNAWIAGIISVVALENPRKAAQHAIGKCINGGDALL